MERLAIENATAAQISYFLRPGFARASAVLGFVTIFN
jgi:hypothetical protein